ncbi:MULTISPECIES: ABC transporter permease [Halolamina]|uniref:Peptide/nickel transport system permease protein n=1 Tax=Halolamina pelagica TaxID=699431 RepID=A0A1I5THA1_9EURY|nr:MULTISPECIES: ABC transporter permease [Halolamina]NHX37346.1 ABC transporter permease [Halolamina sp. R1-12]SFP82298.1 peptide/nickel transport system permease protein [Halolamina pelagica]
MSFRSRLLARFGFAVVAVYLVITLTFLVVVLTPDTNLRGMLGTALWSGASPAEMEQMRETYIAARGRDQPLYRRYLDWVVNITLFRWGLSASMGEPVTQVVGAATLETAKYLVPGAVTAWIAGVAVGIRSARERGSRFDRLGRLATYVLFGLPGFWLAAVALVALDGGGPLTRTVIVPGGAVAAALLAGQVSLTRSRSVDEFDADYVRYLRAKGLTDRGIDRRVFRNVVVPVLSMTAAELFSVLVLSAVVLESLIGIEGVGWLTYEATQENDIPLILGATMVLVAVGIGGSIVCDLASAWLDPRSR